MIEAERARVDARERLLATTDERLVSGGYAALQVADVARAAGVATGTVYRHFPSKTALVAAAFQRAIEPELAAVAQAAAPGRPAAERVAGGIEAFVRRAAAAPKRAYALLAEPVDPKIEMLRHDYRFAYGGIFADALRDGIADGEIEPCDAELFGAAIVGALGEALLGAIACRRPGDPEALIVSLQAFVLSAVAPRRSGVHA